MKIIGYKIYWDNREWILTEDMEDIDAARKYGFQMIPLFTFS
jgi:hypothetical protein